VYLLDTNVISELRKTKPHGAVVAWVQSVPSQSLHLSAVVLGEIQAGIELTREQNTAKAQEIERWLDSLENSFHVLPACTAVYRRWAQITHRKPAHHLQDAMIAATALVHGLTIVTRNTKDFKPFGAVLFNPFTQ
jgi:predicted nucleic acid-binding protein